MRTWMPPTEFDILYHKHMLSAEWSKTRQLAFEYHGRACQACGKKKNLHVHHLDYSNLGKEEMGDLRILCKKCHADLHKKFLKNSRNGLRFFTEQYIREKGTPPKKTHRILYTKGKAVYVKRKKKLSTSSLLHPFEGDDTL